MLACCPLCCKDSWLTWMSWGPSQQVMVFLFHSRDAESDPGIFLYTDPEPGPVFYETVTGNNKNFINF